MWVMILEILRYFQDRWNPLILNRVTFSLWLATLIPYASFARAAQNVGDFF